MAASHSGSFSRGERCRPLKNPWMETQVIESYIFIDTRSSRQLAWNNCCSILFRGRLIVTNPIAAVFYSLRTWLHTAVLMSLDSAYSDTCKRYYSPLDAVPLCLSMNAIPIMESTQQCSQQGIQRHSIPPINKQADTNICLTTPELSYSLAIRKLRGFTSRNSCRTYR